MLALAQGGQDLAVEEMATRFAVSRETIRRDLAQLGASGLLRRVHGGALPPRTAGEARFHHRQLLHAAAKRRIGHAAAALFAPGETLMIDTGSTTEAFAVALGSRRGLTVVTNSVRIAAPIAPGHAVHVLGGAFRGETGQMLGAVCVEQLGRFRADHAVLGIGAISAAGEAMDYDPDEAQLARAMVARAGRVTLLADHSKFDRQALALVCRLGAASRVVTERAPPPAVAAALAASGTELVIAAAAP